MVVAICRCKDEADIIESTVRHMLAECDAVIVADNESTDGTLEILRSIPDVNVQHDTEVGYYQSEAMSLLAALAAECGAEWVVPFDADEWWYSPHGRIADVLGDVTSLGCATATAALYDHIPTALDGTDEDPVKRIGWRRREPAPLPKVACRPLVSVVIEQGNHGASYPTGTVDDLLVVRHYALRSPEQMIRKARNGGKAYAATNLPADVGAHWRQWNELSDEQLGDVFREHYWSADPHADPSLIFDPAPVACPSPS